MVFALRSILIPLPVLHEFEDPDLLLHSRHYITNLLLSFCLSSECLFRFAKQTFLFILEGNPLAVTFHFGVLGQLVYYTQLF